MIQEMQDSILAKLETDLTGILVESYPDDPKNYRLKHRKGAALLRYLGAGFRHAPLEMGTTAAEQFLSMPGAMSLTWQVNLMVRSLRGNEGVYQILDQVRTSLTGFMPIGGQEMLPLKEGFVSEEDGIWNYFIQFRTTT